MSAVLANIPLTTVELPACDPYRLLIFDRSGTQVLLSDKDGNSTLPAVEIPKFTRVLERITSHARQIWGLTTFLLFSNFTPENSGIVYVALEVWRESARSAELEWHSVEDARCQLTDIEQVNVFDELHSRATQKRSAAAPFSGLGWVYRTLDWVRHGSNAVQIVDLLHLSGSDTTCLLRIDLPSQSLWYKAVGNGTPRDFTNSVLLAKWLPDYLPPLLAADSTLNALLMESGGETTLREKRDFDSWAGVAVRLADMQIESVSHASEFVNSGCIDLRIPALQAPLNQFFEFMGELMQQQEKQVPTPLSREESAQVAEAVAQALIELSQIGLPYVIGHSDFNPGNIPIRGDRSVFVDWEAGHVGNPILTIEYLIAHFKKTCAALPGQDYMLRQVFWDKWHSIISDSGIRRIRDIAPLIAVYASAIASGSWRDSSRLARHGIPGYLRSLGRLMHRESRALHQRRICA
jgi:hypothetical protein